MQDFTPFKSKIQYKINLDYTIDELMLEKIKISSGQPKPLGFFSQGNKSNFSLFSAHATQVILVLFNGTEKKEIPLNKVNHIWCVAIEGIPPGAEYAFKVNGPVAPKKGLYFQKDFLLGDPYSKMPATPSEWGKGLGSNRSLCAAPQLFDWQNVSAPHIPKENLIIYEMHTRGFTKDPSSKATYPGTFLGIIEKIPYLKKLGVNAVELMPIFEFNEAPTKEKINYWGYSPLYFFAPMRRFAFKDPILEFKMLVRELHRNGIEILLDVVYNHTGEGASLENLVHFRGIDNPTYYMLDAQGHYFNFSGCSNTFNVNHPVVSELILDSLRYWVNEMRVDGFRFDLASIFNREPNGAPTNEPPILKAINSDPTFQNTKLIAEPWDAAGLYQLGEFGKSPKWSEWNGLFRDRVRQFIKGTDNTAGEFSKVLTGSQFLYGSSSPLSSVNFVTAHDGFTLYDLVSYEKKRNFENREMNRDGNDHNDNWNCGAEGESKDPQILLLRERQMRNFFLALFLAQGIPMIAMGDEYGHTAEGNNNPYVQDNEISWFLWDQLKEKSTLFHFVSSLISFRKKHQELFHSHFLGESEIEWHGTEPLKANWGSKLVAFTLKGASPLYIAFNADHIPQTVNLPTEISWKEIVKTEKPWDQNYLNAPDKAPTISSIELIPYSACIAKGV